MVAIGSLTSSCQSSRPSFSFQPMPGRVQVGKTAGVTVAAPVTAPASGALPITVAQAQPLASPSAAPTVVPQQQPRPELAGFLAKKVVSLPALRPAGPHRRTLLVRPHATAEAGLGTTVFGILGLITLPIALLGLLLSGGGLGWGIVAGAAALAVLVAYLDPFGRR